MKSVSIENKLAIVIFAGLTLIICGILVGLLVACAAAIAAFAMGDYLKSMAASLIAIVIIKLITSVEFTG